MQRLDKYLSDAGAGSRKELRQWIRKGQVTVNGCTETDESRKLDETRDQVCLRGVLVDAFRLVVGMLHKPAGFVTSTDEPGARTVMELLPEQYRRLSPVPVGRLDKDTEGLLLFTNDGDLAHRLISPKYRVEKEYFARVDGLLSQKDAAAFAQGLVLGDGTTCRPAVLRLEKPGECRVILTEGKYHQVRRMLASRGAPVTYLRREREGALTLGMLPLGGFRELTGEETFQLRRECGLED